MVRLIFLLITLLAGGLLALTVFNLFYFKVIPFIVQNIIKGKRTERRLGGKLDREFSKGCPLEKREVKPPAATGRLNPEDIEKAVKTVSERRDV